MTILFVEDDETIASGIMYALETEGYLVTWYSTVSATLANLGSCSFSLALLDLSLPDGTGFEILQRIKEVSNTPVIFLTAVDDEGNIVKGLEMGADDYITKPFRVRELCARIKSVLRRGDSSSTPADKFVALGQGAVVINWQSGKVYKNGMEVFLSAQEYKLLLYFGLNKGKILTRAQLLHHVGDVADSFINDNTLTVYIKRLREKLEDDSSNTKIIETVRGIGYRGI